MGFQFDPVIIQAPYDFSKFNKKSVSRKRNRAINVSWGIGERQIYQAVEGIYPVIAGRYPF